MHACVWCGEGKAKPCHGYSGPRGLGSFSLGSILMSKKASHTCHAWKESEGADAGLPGSPGVGHKEGDTSLKRNTCLRWGDCA